MTASVIIVRRRGGGGEHGHHGGAWKVAYADFVTAMMAFFLLMWLLNATTEEQRRGIADYFDPSVPIAAISGGGSDMLEGSTVYAADTLAHDNHGGEVSEQEAFVAKADEALAQMIADALMDSINESQMKVTLSDEGVEVELLEAEGSPLFALGNAAPSDLLAKAVAEIVPVIIESGRTVKIVGHTDALKYREGSPYTNWELSADRANAARRLTVQAGLDPDQITEVVGRADKFPLVTDRAAPENRRISIIMQKS